MMAVKLAKVWIQRELKCHCVDVRAIEQGQVFASYSLSYPGVKSFHVMQKAQLKLFDI